MMASRPRNDDANDEIVSRAAKTIMESLKRAQWCVMHEPVDDHFDPYRER